MKVLALVCGLWGSTFHMANQYGVIVVGIDISEKMICLAKSRLKEEGLKNIVSLEKADCL